MSAAALYGVFGTGGCGRGVMPVLRAQLTRTGLADARAALVFVDDAPPATHVNGARVLSWEAFLSEPASERRMVLAIADPSVRERLAARCAAADVRFCSVRAETVVMHDEVAIAEGAVLCPFVTVASNTRIGRHFQANLYAYVEHDCVIGDFVTFAPGVKCNGNVRVGDRAYIGSGAVIRQGRPGAPLTIGAGAVIGMGAVVTRDVPPGTTVVGNPARRLRNR